MGKKKSAKPKKAKAHAILGETKPGGSPHPRAGSKLGQQPSELGNPLGQTLFERACQAHQRNDLAQAEHLYRQALEVDAELIDGWRNLGAMLRQQGRTAEGLRCTEEAIKRRPDDGSLWGNAGNALRDLNRLEESKKALEKAIALNPNSTSFGPQVCLAITFNKAGDYWGLIQRFLPKLDELPQEANPAASDLLLEVGNAYHHLGQNESALTHWRRALQLATGEKQLLMVLNTAQVLCELNQHQKAESLLKEQESFHPKSANLFYALGVTAKGQGRWEEACERFDGALALDPDYVICLNSYGLLLRDMGRSHQARTCFERALAVDPEFGAAMNNLGSVLKDVARYPEALEWLRRGAEALKGNPGARSNVLFTLVGYELEPAQQRFEEAKRFAEEFATSPFERCRDRIPLPDPQRRLKIGLISPDFCRHAVSYFIEPLLEQWDRQELHLTLYACGTVRDEYTKRLQGKVERWRDLNGVSDENAVLQILRDEIDILVDLAGHTAGNRLQLMAMKPAPIQATYLGYYGTTGLSQMDYWISDHTLHPEDGQAEEELCSETLWRLERPYLTYRPLAEAPAVAPLPMLNRGFPMVGSFNQSRKITHTTAERWMAVMEAIPSAHLLLKSKNLGEPTEAARIKELFAGLGLAAERLHLEGHSPSVAAHLDRYRELDLALDTFPYTGCTTSADALWMGVPVLTVAGNSMVSRQSAAVLVAAGHPEWVCSDPAELAAKAQGILAQPAKLAALRQGLRHQIGASALLDHKGLASSLASSFRVWWQRWLAEHMPAPEAGQKLEPWPLRLAPPPVALRCPYPR